MRRGEKILKKLIFQKDLTLEKQRVNSTLENECEIKKFKSCAVYSKVRPF